MRVEIELAGRRVAGSRVACIRRFAAAISAKSPPSRKEREKSKAPAFVCVVKSMGQPPKLQTGGIQSASDGKGRRPLLSSDGKWLGLSFSTAF